MKHVGSYRSLWETGELEKRQAAAWDRLIDCDLCGHRCRVNRLAGETGICRADDTVQVSSFGAHLAKRVPPLWAHAVGHYILYRMQPQMRILPKLGHQSNADGPYTV